MPRAPSLALRWWAQQWIEPVESLGPEYAGRLSRARSYARNRRIWQLSVRPGMLSAQALGSFGYYAVTVHVPSNPDGVWERVQTTLSAHPALLASLLADDLPADVEQVFNDAGGSLFYGDAELLGFHCTCLDWQRPCKHTLAVCYDFATQASAHPGLLLALAGRTVEQIVAALQARWAPPTRSAPIACRRWRIEMLAPCARLASIAQGRRLINSAFHSRRRATTLRCCSSWASRPSPPRRKIR